MKKYYNFARQFFMQGQFMLINNEIEELLNRKAEQYNHPSFIENDPVSIPHRFSKTKDIEIAGFFAAILAWGNRKSIIKSSLQLMSWMDNTPHDFIINATPADLAPLKKFVYRTFNGIDCIGFIQSIQNIYKNQGGLKGLFEQGYSQHGTVKDTIQHFRSVFTAGLTESRSFKHVANPGAGSAAKRINMYLRWMIRNDQKGVDFGLWNFIHTSELMIPLDVHSATVARKLLLLKRNQNDWKAVEELTTMLKKLDPKDPIKYDFALFGIGVNRELEIRK